MSDHWLARRAEAEREWFRNEHERQFGKPSREETDDDMDKVIEKFKKQARRRVSERKYYEPTVLLPPPLEPVDWTGAPLALKCVCPTGDCACTCKGNTLLPRKRINFMPRYNWWGLKTLYWMLPCVKYPQPTGTLAPKFAEAANIEWHFYRSEEGRKILIERGPEFCLSGCLKFFLTDRKIQKNFTALITEMKANVNVDEPMEDMTQDDTENVVQKKIFSDRICDQFRCTVSTQSHVDGDGEFLVGDYSHLLFGSNDENLFCDIDGKELHVAAHKDMPEDPCAFMNVSRTVNKLFHVTEIKERISNAKKNLISSIFEIPERFNSKASQYECQDIPLELSEGLCESLADVRRKLKEKEQLKRKLCESQLRRNKLEESIIESSDEELSDNDELVESMDKTNPEAMSLSILEKSLEIENSIKFGPTDKPLNSKDLMNTPCNRTNLSNVTKTGEDSKSLDIKDINLRDSITSIPQKDIEDAHKSLLVDKENLYENIKSALENNEVSKVEENQKLDETFHKISIIPSLNKKNVKNEWMPCKAEINTDSTKLELDRHVKSVDTKLTKDIDLDKHNLGVINPKENLDLEIMNDILKNVDIAEVNEVKKKMVNISSSIVRVPLNSEVNKFGKVNTKYEWMPCMSEIVTDKDNLEKVKLSNNDLLSTDPSKNVDIKSVKNATKIDQFAFEVAPSDESSNKKMAIDRVEVNKNNLDKLAVAHEIPKQLTVESKNMKFSGKQISVSFKDQLKFNVNEWMPCKNEKKSEHSNWESIENRETADVDSHKEEAEKDNIKKNNIHRRELSIVKRELEEVKYLDEKKSNIIHVQDKSKYEVDQWMPCKSQTKLGRPHLYESEVKKSVHIKLNREIDEIGNINLVTIDDKPDISNDSKSAKNTTDKSLTRVSKNIPEKSPNGSLGSEIESKKNQHSKPKESFKYETKPSITKRISQKSQIDPNSNTTGPREVTDNADMKPESEILQPKNDIKMSKANEWMPCKPLIETGWNETEPSEQKSNVTCTCKDDVKKCWNSFEIESASKGELPKTVSKGSKFSWKSLFHSSGRISKKSSAKNPDDIKLNSSTCCTKCSKTREYACEPDINEFEKIGDKLLKSKNIKSSSGNRKPPGDVAEQDSNEALKSDVEKYYRFYF